MHLNDRIHNCIYLSCEYFLFLTCSLFKRTSVKTQTSIICTLLSWSLSKRAQSLNFRLLFLFFHFNLQILQRLMNFHQILNLCMRFLQNSIKMVLFSLFLTFQLKCLFYQNIYIYYFILYYIRRAISTQKKVV